MIDLTPHARATHWSARWIGRAWAPSFSCWDLVQEVQASLGRTMPALDVSGQAPDQSQTLAALMRHGRWHPAPEWHEGDVLLMRNGEGPHVGVAIGRTQVLHNLGGLRNGKAWGSVRVDEIGHLGLMGYGQLRAWRHA